MDIEINEDILKDTTECINNFSCLRGEKECLCEVRGYAGYNSVLINPKPNKDCSYLNPFGSSFFCFCPTRSEIYRRYGV